MYVVKIWGEKGGGCYGYRQVRGCRIDGFKWRCKQKARKGVGRYTVF